MDNVELAHIARIFSNPSRLSILQYIAESGSCVINELVSNLALSQSTVSQHLRDLKMAGIITGTIVDNTVVYSIENSRWLEIKEDFDHLFSSVKTKKQSAKN